MFPTKLAIKTTAKQTLSKAWPQAIALVFLLFGVLITPSLLIQFLDLLTASALSKNEMVAGGIGTVFSVFIFYPLLFGCLRWFWGITAAEDMPLSVVFFPFADSKEYGKALKIIYAFGWRLFLADLPRSLSLLLEPSYFSFLPTEIDIAALLGLFQGICESFSIFISVWIVFKLLPLPFLVINHPSHRISDNIKESIIISKKASMQYLALFGSMLGWLFLSLLILPLIYTIPYFIACFAVATRFSINYCLSQSN